MRTIVVKISVALALVLTLFVGSVGAIYAAPSSGGQPPKATPNVAPCTQFINTDKKASSSSDPVAGNGYTLTVWVEFRYDAFYNHDLCYTRSKATISENGNLYDGTLYLYLSNCSGNIDTVTPHVNGGGGNFTFYGNLKYAGCGQVTANFKASNGYWLPGQYSYADSGRQLS